MTMHYALAVKKILMFKNFYSIFKQQLFWTTHIDLNDIDNWIQKNRILSYDDI